MSEKNPDKIQQAPSSKPESNPNGFQRLMKGIGNGMESVGKGLYSVVKGVAKIPVAVVRGADAIVSRIPIAGQVYGAGKEVVRGVWGITEQLPVVGSVFKGLRVGANKIAQAVGFKPEDLQKIGVLQKGLQKTPNDLQIMLDSSKITGEEKEILQNMIEINKVKGETVSTEDFDEFKKMVDDAQKPQEYSGSLVAGGVAETCWNIPGENFSHWTDESGQRQASSFSSHPLSDEEYQNLIGSSDSSDSKFPAPPYEELSDRQKRFLDTCKTQICPDGSPTQQQKELISAMAYVSEAFSNKQENSLSLMNSRMQSVQSTYGDKMPEKFKSMFNAALDQGRQTDASIKRVQHS